jgi:hypothetical protein
MFVFRAAAGVMARFLAQRTTDDYRSFARRDAYSYSVGSLGFQRTSTDSETELLDTAGAVHTPCSCTRFHPKQALLAGHRTLGPRRSQ